METLSLHELHQHLGARFALVNGAETVADYGDPLAEHRALRESAAVLDLSFRSRLCLTGNDRVRFLHGQVTNDIKRLRLGEGCYAALVSAKGRMESDLNVYALGEELLLDCEPGQGGAVSQRLERFIVADDVQVVDVAPLFGLLSVQGPNAEAVVRQLELTPEPPRAVFQVQQAQHATLGELYLVNQPRIGSSGFELYAPFASLEAIADKLVAASKAVGGGPAGWQALELARVEAGIPRFGIDMDERNFPQECGIEARAVSYSKGCYIGQEVLNRIHTLGHVNRTLCGLRLQDQLPALPARDDKLLRSGKEIGYVTSAVASPALHANIALGYLRHEAANDGGELVVRTAAGESPARVVPLPFAAA
jgi:folate-binding protein YgfZ